eukprot:TRINITY_DN5740_c0_g1_i1.p1 TRINITY_DN5740_c0_g1~~TRINITY_DN5740_c0_g1_i1.p1  ORF type:complete len:307 (+),score=86.34 TRINITY_DN5740_c0_g1_i1:63-983(+)
MASSPVVPWVGGAAAVAAAVACCLRQRRAAEQKERSVVAAPPSPPARADVAVAQPAPEQPAAAAVQRPPSPAKPASPQKPAAPEDGALKQPSPKPASPGAEQSAAAASPAARSGSAGASPQRAQSASAASSPRSQSPGEKLARDLEASLAVLQKPGPVDPAQLKAAIAATIAGGYALEHLEPPELQDRVIDVLDKLHPAIADAKGRTAVAPTPPDPSKYELTPAVSEPLRELCVRLRDSPPTSAPELAELYQELIGLADSSSGTEDEAALRYAMYVLMEKKQKLVGEAMEAHEAQGGAAEPNGHLE